MSEGYRRRRTVAVISVPFGGGHEAVAQAVGESVSDADAEVTVIDGLAAISRRVPLSAIGATLYFLLMTVPMRPVYERLFIAVDRWPCAVGRICSRVFGRRVRAWLQVNQPDVIVSTFPLVTFVLGEAIAAVGARARLVSIVTDGGTVNRSWFSGRADVFVVTDDEAHAVGEAELSDRLRLVQTRLPLRAGFVNPGLGSADDARADLGLSTGSAVLIWGGGQGMARGMITVAKEMRRHATTVTPIFVTGTNRRLARRLAALTADSEGLVLERCDDVPRLMSVVDSVIGKAGWVSLAEAAAAGLHTICIDALPGQEQENLRVCVDRGSASWEPDIPTAVRMAVRARRRPASWRSKDGDADLIGAVLGDALPFHNAQRRWANR